MGDISNIFNALLHGNVRFTNYGPGSILAVLFILSPIIATFVVGAKKGRGWAGVTFFVSWCVWIGLVYAMAQGHWGFYAPAADLSLILPLAS